MKKLLIVALVVFILAAAALPALAAENSDNPKQNGGTQNTIEENNGGPLRRRRDRKLESADNTFIMAGTARQTNRTEGDLAALGVDAEVSRGVGGDVFTAGRNVLVTDDEKLQNVAAAGANVNIHVKSARNIYAAGGDIDVQADENVKGVYIAGLSVTLSGTLTDAIIAAASVNIAGTIDKNLTIRAGNVTFDPDATVGGEITIFSKKRPVLPASIDPSKVTYKTPGVFGRLTDSGAEQTVFGRLTLLLTISGVVAAALLSLVLNAMRGGFFHERAEGFRRFFWRDMLRGFAGVIITPVLALLLLVSVVGAPVGLLLLLLYAVALYLAPIVSGVVLGRLIFPKLSRFLSGAVVTLFVWLLMLVPYLGIAVTIASVLLGTGTLISAIPPRRNRLRVFAKPRGTATAT